MDIEEELFDEEDEEESSGGVREPKKPILPFLPGDIKLEVEREEEIDLCVCSNK